jgi:formylglycine-generating enzyme required for sulfatase activity
MADYHKIPLRFGLGLVVLLLASCSLDTPSQFPRDNPLDANNPDTHGDPYHLTAELADGGVRLSWQAVNWAPLVGYSIYRKEDAGASARLQQIGVVTTYTDRAIRNGHRYEYYVVARSNSGEGEASQVVKATVNAAPVIFIEGQNVAQTPTRNVTLSLIAYGGERMLLSNSSDFTGATWEPFTVTKSWQLTTGSGTKTVYLRVAFNSGDTSAVYSDQIDPAALNPVLQILPDSTYINHVNVTLSMPNTGASEMKVSNSADSASVNWQAYNPQLNWNLSAGDGWKTIYAWFRNDFFAAGPAVDTVGLDTRASIATFDWTHTGGDTLIPGNQVTFTMRAADDAFGADTGGRSSVTVEGWQPIGLAGQAGGIYSATYTITDQTPEVRSARVTVTLTDRAGNATPTVVSDQQLTMIQPHPAAGTEREFRLGNTTIRMCWIPAGSYLMGRYSGEQDSDPDEVDQHRVTFARGFWLSKYEVTQLQWVRVMGSNPASGYGVGDTYPVYYVSWDDIHRFESRLAAQGDTFRLPSESEWEYACRAGTATRFYWGDDPNYSEIGRYAVYSGNDINRSEPVGSKLANAWGLCDMSGNVWEWCEDWYHDSYNVAGRPDDGSAWVAGGGTYRVLRGGSWTVTGRYCRSAGRYWNFPDFRNFSYGFRVVYGR